jgi:DNA-binding NtrC family response regulator
MNVLIVDDQRSARRVLSDLVKTRTGVQIAEAATVSEARTAMTATRFDLAFVDLRLSDDPRDRGGLEVLELLRSQGPCLVVMVTGHGAMADVRAAMRRGAWDYVLKDDVCEELVGAMLDEAANRFALEREVLSLRAAQRETQPDGMIGASEPLRRLRDAISRVATSRRPVLVVGPTGVGKELVVRTIHRLGANPTAPFIDLNCGALPGELIESQLFGHERGAFTGAERRSAGLLAATGQGTLFLDEIAELPLAQQTKLLRVLESGRFRPVGATEDLPFTGRVVAATHAALEQRVVEGRFREDLLHRLNVLQLNVPSLDERRDDIPALVSHFARDQPRPLRLTDDAMQVLVTAQWSGNVRQLRNVIDRLAVFVDEDPIGAEAVRRWLLPRPTSVSSVGALVAAALSEFRGEDVLLALERACIEEAMARTNGNKSAAARVLGVHRKVIERRLGSSETDDDDPNQKAR